MCFATDVGRRLEIFGLRSMMLTLHAQSTGSQKKVEPLANGWFAVVVMTIFMPYSSMLGGALGLHDIGDDVVT